jgi:hypothetical protein
MAGSAIESAPAQRVITEQHAHDIARDAYIFGYPLVLMDVTKKLSTAVPRPQGHKAPVNQFGHLRSFPDAAFTDVVSPNADTLYSVAWLDLSNEPIILSVPEMGTRFYLLQMMDAWTNVFADPGTRTTGNGKGDFAIVGPRWAGRLPNGVKELESSTNTVWIAGRTQTNGKEDYRAVHAVQDQYKLTPLRGWGKSYKPPTDMAIETGADVKTPPSEQVTRMNAAEFFTRLNTLMKNNPPAAADSVTLKRFAAIGVEPGAAFDLKKKDRSIVEGIERGIRSAKDHLEIEARKPLGQMVNGWSVMTENVGRFGTDYVFRAAVARIALGANLPEDAVYPMTRADASGHPLNGRHRYVLRFAKGQLPPARAFWSVTMYNATQAFVDNPIGRYALGDRDRMKFDQNDSLSLYIQHSSPGGDKESNWLPAPSDDFNLIMRVYWPAQEVLDGTWTPPPVEKEA